VLWHSVLHTSRHLYTPGMVGVCNSESPAGALPLFPGYLTEPRPA